MPHIGLTRNMRSTAAAQAAQVCLSCEHVDLLFSVPRPAGRQDRAQIAKCFHHQRQPARRLAKNKMDLPERHRAPANP